MHINLQEIPDEYRFQDFAADYLQALGMVIYKRGAVGPDGQKDIICGQRTEWGEFRWLVSCKHRRDTPRPYGADVLKEFRRSHLDEHKVQGYMIFMSANFTEGLTDALHELFDPIKVPFRIENANSIIRNIIVDPRVTHLAYHYFPQSITEAMAALNAGLCCQGAGLDVYLVSYREKYSQKVEKKKACEWCIDSWVQYFDDNNIEHGISRISSVST